MASVPVMLREVLQPRARDLLGGERLIPFDRLQSISRAGKPAMEMVRELTSVDVIKHRPGKFIPFRIVPHIEKKKVKRTRTDSRKPAKPKATDDGGLLSGAFERTPENAFSRRPSNSPDVKSGAGKSAPKISLRSAKPPTSAKATPEKPSKLALRSAPLPVRSAPLSVDKVKPREGKAGSSSKAPPQRNKREASVDVDERSPKKSKASLTKLEEAKTSRRSEKETALKAKKKKKSSSEQDNEERSRKPLRHEETRDESPVRKRRSSSSQDTEERTKNSSRRDSASNTPRKDGKSTKPLTLTSRTGEDSASRAVDKWKNGKEAKVSRHISVSLRSAPAPAVSTPENPNTPSQSATGSSTAHAVSGSAGDGRMAHDSRQLARSSILSARFSALKAQVEELWKAKEYDRYETVSREAVKACFDWGLAKEMDMRRRENELRKNPKARDNVKQVVWEHYNYMVKRVVQTTIDNLNSINRKPATAFFQKVIHKCYLRMFALPRLWVPEKGRKDTKMKGKVDTAIASMGRALESGRSEKEAKVSFSLSELKDIRSIVVEYSNLFRLCDALASNAGEEPEEPGKECYLQ